MPGWRPGYASVDALSATILAPNGARGRSLRRPLHHRLAMVPAGKIAGL